MTIRRTVIILVKLAALKRRISGPLLLGYPKYVHAGMLRLNQKYYGVYKVEKCAG